MALSIPMSFSPSVEQLLKICQEETQQLLLIKQELETKVDELNGDDVPDASDIESKINLAGQKLADLAVKCQEHKMSKDACLEEKKSLEDQLRVCLGSNNELEQVARLLAECERQRKKCEDRRTDLSQKHSLAQTELERLRAENASIKQQLQSVTQEKGTEEKRAVDCQTELMSANRRVRDLENGLNFCTAKELEVKQQLDNCKIELRRVKDNIQTHLGDKARLKDEHAKVVNQLALENNTLKQNLDGSVEQFGRMRSEYAILQSELKDTKDLLSQSENGREKMVGEFGRMRSQYATLQSELKDTKDLLSQSENGREKMAGEFGRMRSQYATLQSELKDSKDLLSRSEDERKKMAEVLENGIAQNSHLLRELKKTEQNLNAQATIAKGIIDSCASQLRDCITKATAEIKQRDGIIESQRERIVVMHKQFIKFAERARGVAQDILNEAAQEAGQFVLAQEGKIKTLQNIVRFIGERNFDNLRSGRQLAEYTAALQNENMRLRSMMRQAQQENVVFGNLLGSSVVIEEISPPGMVVSRIKAAPDKERGELVAPMAATIQQIEAAPKKPDEEKELVASMAATVPQQRSGQGNGQGRGLRVNTNTPPSLRLNLAGRTPKKTGQRERRERQNKLLRQLKRLRQEKLRQRRES